MIRTDFGGVTAQAVLAPQEAEPHNSVGHMPSRSSRSTSSYQTEPFDRIATSQIG
jgi:hypothetical protein